MLTIFNFQYYVPSAANPQYGGQHQTLIQQQPPPQQYAVPMQQPPQQYYNQQGKIKFEHTFNWQVLETKRFQIIPFN
jgi:hypothetical protein